MVKNINDGYLPAADVRVPDKGIWAEGNKGSALYTKRLMERRKMLRLSQKELAKIVGVSVNTIQSYETGNLPRGEHFLALAKALGCSLDWLSGLDASFSDMLDTGCLSGDNIVGDQRAIWGYARPGGSLNYITLPTFEEDQDSLAANEAATITFDRTWLARVATAPGNVRLVFVDGPCMSPTLLDGDMVLVDLGRNTVRQGRLYALNIDGNILINRLESRPGGILRIVSDNRDIAPPYEVDAEQVRVLGHVFWLGRRLV